MVPWFHQVKQLFLIPIPGVLTQTLGNIVGTWSALWSLTVSVLFLRLCYSRITLYQQYENNLVGPGHLFGVCQFVCFSLAFVVLVFHCINNMKTILAGNANAFLKNQINNMERKIHSTVNVLYPCDPAYLKLVSVQLPKAIP